MPELLPTYVLMQWRRLALPVVGALSLYGLPACALAQTVPDSVRACAAESDPGRRLACYDRQMARFPAPAARPGVARPPVEAAHASQAAPAPQAAAASNAASARAPHAVVPTPAAPKVAGRKTPVPRRKPVWKIFAGAAPWHLTARVVRLERWPDAMVLHLDNGQVWRQIGRASGDLNLHTGDSVTIERHLGSYWLSSGYVSNMQVRLEPR